MSSATPGPAPRDRSDADEAYWRRRLGRLRLGVEPIPVQVERYRRVTWAFTAVAGTVGLMFVGLFAAFRRPGIGLALALILMGPLVLLCWVDFLRLRGRAAEYLRAQGQAADATDPARPAV